MDPLRDPLRMTTVEDGEMMQHGVVLGIRQPQVPLAQRPDRCPIGVVIRFEQRGARDQHGCRETKEESDSYPRGERRPPTLVWCWDHSGGVGGW